MSTYLDNLFSLKGRVAIVTGAAAGMGAEMAKGLASAGAKVAVVDLNEEGGKEVAAQINADGGEAEFYSLDLTDTDKIELHTKQVNERFGGLNILVNAAGITLPLKEDDPLEKRLSNFDITMAVDLRAAYAMALSSAEYMAKSGNGSIINVTSINSIVGFPGNPGYVAAKGGLRMLTKGLAIDLIKNNIRVNNIAPGYIKTAMTAGSQSDPELYAARMRHMIVPRWGEAEDMIGATIFLASDASSYVTGQDIFVDGGWTAKGIT